MHYKMLLLACCWPAAAAAAATAATAAASLLIKNMIEETVLRGCLHQQSAPNRLTPLCFEHGYARVHTTSSLSINSATRLVAHLRVSTKHCYLPHLVPLSARNIAFTALGASERSKSLFKHCSKPLCVQNHCSKSLFKAQTLIQVILRSISLLKVTAQSH